MSDVDGRPEIFIVCYFVCVSRFCLHLTVQYHMITTRATHLESFAENQWWIYKNVFVNG